MAGATLEKMENRGTIVQNVSRFLGALQLEVDDVDITDVKAVVAFYCTDFVLEHDGMRMQTLTLTFKFGSIIIGSILSCQDLVDEFLNCPMLAWKLKMFNSISLHCQCHIKMLQPKFLRGEACPWSEYQRIWGQLQEDMKAGHHKRCEQAND
eukprot:5003007-Amphidinium_carterae.2